MANIQFNSKDAKGFRCVCEKYYKARHAMAEALAKANDGYNAAKSIHDIAVADKVALDAGEYTGHRSADDIDADIATYGKRMTEFKEVRDKVKSDQKQAIDNGLALYTDAMHTAAGRVITEFGSDESILAWHTALSDMLRANGVNDAIPANVVRFDFAVNAKAASNNKTVISGVSIGIGSKSQSAVLFMNAFTEYLTQQGIIAPFKHKYVPVAEKKRLERLAAKSAK